MAPFLRLRQVCLVAAELARETELLGSIFGLQVCHRDSNVAKYGLENVLFPVGTNFIEIVSPTRPGTAAGRFLERHGGRFGYMVIMDCDDPGQRQAHATVLGVRVANVIRHGDYLGVQLHPKDTGAAMIEFNRTAGGADPMGPYSPAGAAWQKCIRTHTTRRLLAVEIESPDPSGLAARWAEIVQRPLQDLGGNRYCVALDEGAIRFLPTTATEAGLAGIELEVANVANVANVVAAAQARGCESGDGTVTACGVRFRLRAPGSPL